MTHFNKPFIFGCLIIAAGMVFASVNIQTGLTNIQNGLNTVTHSIAHILPSNLHHALHNHTQNEPADFMSDWEAAQFLSFPFDDFTALANSGELSGTYTTFQTERRIWTRAQEFHDLRSGRITEYNVSAGIEAGIAIQAVPWLSIADTLDPAHPVPAHGGRTVQLIPPNATYELVTHDHRVFSREKLTAWLNNRITATN
ncbi:MAG: hypothetical protein FWB96_13315 [Defluviitaleaceae bacterium]|nr:hypothetical protein [Defluviitaleaceae bacterium]MCL2264240.1 hypothetical protein [Defluviitaleaceae bacterium]